MQSDSSLFGAMKLDLGPCPKIPAQARITSPTRRGRRRPQGSGSHRSSFSALEPCSSVYCCRPCVPLGLLHTAQCANNLKQVALALRDYENYHHALPPAWIVDADGKPLHSWRTLILPFIGEQRLYETIDLSKAWNDPANAEAYKTGVHVFRCPMATCPENHTTYLASVAPNGCFRLTEPRHFSEISDGLSNTLMVIEVPAEQSVHWMSPVDADESLVMGLGAQSKLTHNGGMNAALCDGSVRFLRADTPAATRRALISIAGGEEIAGKIAD